MTKNIAFRVDASSRFGTGHVARTRHLANKFQDQGYTVDWVATAETFDLVPSLMDQYRCFAIDANQNQAEQVSQYFEKTNKTAMPEFVVQDGFHMDKETVSAVEMHAPRTKMVVVEDKGNRPMGAPDYLVDPSFNAMSIYTRDILSPHSQILLGARYQMLSPEFQNVRTAREQSNKKNEIVLMNGGGNIGNLLGQMVNALALHPNHYQGYQFKAYTLSSSRDIGLLQGQVLAAQERGLPVELCLDQKPDFTNTALYVGAAGTACYELGASGGVASVLIGAGHNQDAIACQLGKQGAGVYAGQFLDLNLNGTFNAMAFDFMDRVVHPVKEILSNEALRNKMAMNSAKFCDGLGVERVFEAITKPEKMPAQSLL